MGSLSWFTTRTTHLDIQTAQVLGRGVQVLERIAAQKNSHLRLLLLGLQGSSPMVQSLHEIGRPGLPVLTLEVLEE